MSGVPLIVLAHARSGDKGNRCNIGLIAREPGFYPILLREVTAERVRNHFAGACRGKVEQGKTYGSALLRMEVDANPR